MLDNFLLLKFAEVTVFSLMLTNGITISFQNLLSVWHRPGLLMRSLLAVIVLVPIVVIVLLTLFDLPPDVAKGLTLLAAAPGAPLTAKRSKMAGGDISYAAGLQLTLVSSAILITPFTLALFHSLFEPGRQMAMTPLEVAKQVTTVSFFPVGIGLLLQKVAPGIAEVLGKPLSLIANGLFLVLALLIAVPAIQLTWQIRVMPILAIVIMATAALVIGHLLGRPGTLNERAAIATACIARNLGLVIYIAAVNGILPNLLPTIVAYMILGVFVALPYAVWIRLQLSKLNLPEKTL
ncbi:MAG: bile acid:sodium symporter family protein [Prochloraceae cyanobacterium]